ncbi:MAG: cytochrome C oxidase subunit IV family protein [Candidatus Acidiferrales bacterium]
MEQQQQPSMKVYVGVWVGLIAIVLFEVFLTYLHLAPRTLIAFLLPLAFIEAGIGIAYFMHMKYESPKLFWSLVPITLFVLFMLDHIWPDAFRLARMSLLH